MLPNEKERKLTKDAEEKRKENRKEVSSL